MVIGGTCLLFGATQVETCFGGPQLVSDTVVSRFYDVLMVPISIRLRDCHSFKIYSHDLSFGVSTHVTISVRQSTENNDWCLPLTPPPHTLITLHHRPTTVSLCYRSLCLILLL